jgi:hypothetical protein
MEHRQVHKVFKDIHAKTNTEKCLHISQSEMYTYTFQLGNLKERDYLEELGRDGKITKDLRVEKCIWLRTRTNVKLL